MERRRRPVYWFASCLAGGLALGVLFLYLADTSFTGRARSLVPTFLLVFASAGVGTWFAARQWRPGRGGVIAGCALLVVAGLAPVVFAFVQSAHTHCGPTTQAMEWHEPGLYATLTAGEGLFWEPGDGALGDATAGPPGLRLVRLALAGPPVEEGPHGHERPTTLSLERDGVIRTVVEGRVDEQMLHGLFVQAVQDLTDADPDAVDDAWRSFLDSRDVAFTAVALDDGVAEDITYWQYEVRAPGALVLDRFLGAQVDPSGVGAASARVGPWEATYSLPKWTHRDGDQRLQVDSADSASFFAGARSGSPEEVAAAARDALRVLGRDEPRFEDVEYATVVC